MLSNFKTYYNTTVIQTMKRGTGIRIDNGIYNQWNGIENPEINPNIYA